MVAAQRLHAFEFFHRAPFPIMARSLSPEIFITSCIVFIRNKFIREQFTVEDLER